jgi:hypothetical protein
MKNDHHEAKVASTRIYRNQASLKPNEQPIQPKENNKMNDVPHNIQSDAHSGSHLSFTPTHGSEDAEDLLLLSEAAEYFEDPADLLALVTSSQIELFRLGHYWFVSRSEITEMTCPDCGLISHGSQSHEDEDEDPIDIIPFPFKGTQDGE